MLVNDPLYKALGRLSLWSGLATNLRGCCFYRPREGVRPRRTRPPTACCLKGAPRSGKVRCWSAWLIRARTGWRRRPWGSRTAARRPRAGSPPPQSSGDGPERWYLQHTTNLPSILHEKRTLTYTHDEFYTHTHTHWAAVYSRFSF